MITIADQYNQHYRERQAGVTCGTCGSYFPEFCQFLWHLTKAYSLILKKEHWTCPMFSHDYNAVYEQKIKGLY